MIFKNLESKLIPKTKTDNQFKMEFAVSQLFAFLTV